MHTAEYDKLGGVSGGARIFRGGAWCVMSVCLVVHSIGLYVFRSASFLVSLSVRLFVCPGCVVYVSVVCGREAVLPLLARAACELRGWCR
jgi:hypothetical protein